MVHVGTVHGTAVLVRITESPMKAGTWNAALKPNVPLSVLSTIVAGLDAADTQVVVFPGQIETSEMDLSLAVFNGVVDIINTAGLTVSGRGVMARWGSDDGAIALRNADPSLGEIVSGGGDLQAQVNEYTANWIIKTGQIQTTSASESTYRWVRGYREKFDEVMSNWEITPLGDAVEYRLAPDGTIDVGTFAFLWPTTDVLLTDQFQSMVFGELRAIQAAASVASADISKRSTATHVSGDETLGLAGMWSTRTSSNGMFTNGWSTSLSRVINEPTIDDQDVADSTAAAWQAQFDNPAQSHTVTVPDPLARLYLNPGQPVYAWFPEHLIVGDDELDFAAHPCWPVPERVDQLAWTAHPDYYTIALYRHQLPGDPSWLDISEYLQASQAPTVADCTTQPFTLQQVLRSGVDRFGEGVLLERIGYE